MYRGNLSLHTFFNFFFIRKFSNFRICSNLEGFNRINSIVILLNIQNQLRAIFRKSGSKWVPFDSLGHEFSLFEDTWKIIVKTDKLSEIFLKNLENWLYDDYLVLHQNWMKMKLSL